MQWMEMLERQIKPGNPGFLLPACAGTGFAGWTCGLLRSQLQSRAAPRKESLNGRLRSLQSNSAT